MEQVKICSKCKLELPLIKFSRNNSAKNGLSSYCKDCARVYHKSLYTRDKERINKKAKQYYINNKDEMNKYHSKYYRDNIYRIWARNTIKHHKKKDIIINITLDDLTKLAKQVSHCYICKCELDWSSGKKNGVSNNSSPSCDRTNNERDININNIQIICRLCNTTKGPRTMDQFKLYCKLVTEL